MSKATENAQQQAATGSDQELVLPDESDRIIADLRHQLSSLQEQLSRYEQSGPRPATPSSAGTGGELATAPGARSADRSWSDEWAPQVADRLRAPAQDLTARLERVIEQVQDASLRAELEHCLQTAFYLFSTFRHISDNHRVLLESLEPERPRISVETLRSALQAELVSQGNSTVPDVAGGWPAPGPSLSASAPAVAATVARIASELIGQVIRVTLESENVQRPSTSGDTVLVTIACAGANPELVALDNAAQLIYRPEVSAVTVVDWLYMEKIVELQGGTLRLYHRGDRAAGFQLRLPVEPGTAR
jgi:hypothetical protein